MCRGFFDIWKLGVIPQVKDLDESLGLVVRGLCGVPPSPPQHVSGVLGVQVRINQGPIAPAKHVRSHSRRARAVLELCHGNPWLSAPFRRRGAHVAPSRDQNTTLLTQNGARCSVESRLLRSHLVPSCRIGRLQLEF